MNGRTDAPVGLRVQILRFPTAEHYIRQMHPEFEFVFNIADHAVAFWGYAIEHARTTQSNMVEVVCAQAKRLDLEKGLRVIIEDESCPEREPGQTAPTASIH